MSKSYASQLEKLDRTAQIIQAKKFRTLEKAAKSDNPNDILTAARLVGQVEKGAQVNPKAFFIDPLEFNSQLGYKDKPYTLTYTTLQRMARTPIINAIIKTRKNQVADFAEPQIDRYSTGFVIQRKVKIGQKAKMDTKDSKIANGITDFLLNGGNRGTWDRQDFDLFIRKIIDDSLTYDQMTWENLRTRGGKLEGFQATDAATFRIADTFYKQSYENPFFQRNGLWRPNNIEIQGKEIQGYLPYYVQVYQTQKVNEFYPWELCFAVRNPSTSIYSNGYGRSESEDLINIVTSMLWGDEYNRRFFSQGSAPKGLLRVKGNVNEFAIEQFKQQWQAMISGVMQSWKTPVVEADVDWIDLQKNNRDMEYSSWIEYLIKLACAIYNIDPSEIGWDISRSSGTHSIFSGSQEERLQHSKDKGLYPLLKFLQRKINKYIVEPLNPDYELVFMGLNGLTIDQELDMAAKKVQNFMTLNEIREQYDLPKLPDGDIVLNATYAQAKNAAEQRAAMASQGGGPGGPGGSEENDGGVQAEEAEEQNPFDSILTDDTEKAEVQDILTKAFDNFLISDDDDTQGQ